MEQFKVQIHSMVDVITNSFTVIYVTTNSNAIEKTKEMINFFLKASGSDKTADDLFTFEIDLVDADSLMEMVCDNIEEYPESDVLGDGDSDDWDSDKVDKIAEDVISRMTLEEKLHALGDSDIKDIVIVKSKNDEGNRLCMADAFTNIFSAEEGGY